MSKSVSHNAFCVFNKLIYWYYLARPSNLAFHDLTIGKIAPKASRALLGLSLKFCPTPSRPVYNIQPSLERFFRSIKVKAHWAGSPPEDCSLKMLVPSSWTPPRWSINSEIERRLNSFKTAVRPLFRLRRVRSNLLPFQAQALKSLQKDENLLVVQCDKNLGPATIERHRYIEFAKNDHLKDGSTYKQISRQDAAWRASAIANGIKKWIKDFQGSLEDNEKRFLRYHLKSNKTPFSFLYLLFKVHKTPLKTRPILSGSGSLLQPLGMWIDDKLQPIAQTCKSYFKSSYVLKSLLMDMELPPNARLFTCDAISMYTNIPTPTALRVVETHLFKNRDKFKHVSPAALMTALKLLMRNNIFQFGDTFWHQTTGTAMGTPPAPPWATLYFGIHEESPAMEHFTQFLAFYKRFIDDGVGIWLCLKDDTANKEKWMAFQAAMNSCPGLTWEFSELSTSIDFMDLTISIDNGRIKTTMFEKALNLYLYIPPHSTHPPGVLNGLVMGNVMRIHTLCSDQPDRHAKMQQFFLRLLARGYKHDILVPLFSHAIRNAEAYVRRGGCRQTPTIEDTKALQQRRVFFHVQYHPKNPRSSTIQRLWHNYLREPTWKIPLRSLRNHKKTPILIDQLTVAYSRPPNLGNLLSYRRFDNLPGPEVSSYLD